MLTSISPVREPGIIREGLPSSSPSGRVSSSSFPRRYRGAAAVSSSRESPRDRRAAEAVPKAVVKPTKEPTLSWSPVPAATRANPSRNSPWAAPEMVWAAMVRRCFFCRRALERV